jgi:N-acetylmuramoyl-L-alanine amidase
MHRLPPIFSYTRLASIFVLAAISVSSHATELKEMTVLAMDGQTQAELKLSDKANYTFFSLSKPERLVLDLPATSLNSAFKLPGINGVISQIRTGQPSPGTLRVVFELSKNIQTKARLEGEGADTRLVLDMLDPNAKPVDTIAAITKTPSASQASSAVNDAVEAPVATKLPEDILPNNPVVVMPEPINIAKGNVRPSKTMQSVLGNAQRDLIVAIDAGHGGKDPGAIGPTGIREKNITLAAARELAKQINAEPGMKAVLIRDNDVFVSLQDRFMKARQAQADLFISVHADAAHSQQAHGSSVYVLSLKGASSQAARWLADKENAADLVGGVELNKDRNLNAVLLDLSQSATMRVSDDIAAEVLGSLKKLGKTHKPQVEHANFVVLRSPDVPSMLIETGFITNPNEERNLSDPDYRARLAKAIVVGVRGYFSKQAPPGTWFAARMNEKEQKPDVQKPVIQKPRQHVVSRGETLTVIAAQHGVPKDSILQANKKRSENVRVGERLMIPVMAMGIPPQ